MQYVAGGATQNSMRAAQWLLQVPGATSYFGSVGDDDYAQKLRSAASASGLNVRPPCTAAQPWGVDAWARCSSRGPPSGYSHSFPGQRPV